MSTHGLRLFVFSTLVLGIASGCAGVPPAPNSPNVPAASEADEDGGWLFDRLTGRKREESPAQPASQVVQASAVEPVRPPRGAPPEQPQPEEQSGFGLSDLAPSKVYKDLKEAAGYGPNENVAKALFEEGETLFNEKNFAEAADKFNDARKRWPDSTIEEDAMFWQGESLFFADKYPKAQDAFDRLLKKYDNSRHLDQTTKRLFAIGQYWEKLHEQNARWPVTPNVTDKKQPMFDTFGNAIKAYETIRLKDPIGPLADDAVMATANAYFRKQRYADAAYHFDILRKEYPKSEHQKMAHLLAVQANMRVYQGRIYDDSPLADADEIAEQAIIQFQSELGEERQRMLETRQQIAEEKAQRDIADAEYYERKKYFGSARFYYRSVIKEYPLSAAARQAQARLEQIRNEPDEPPNRFSWLTDRFERKE